MIFDDHHHSYDARMYSSSKIIISQSNVTKEQNSSFKVIPYDTPPPTKILSGIGLQSKVKGYKALICLCL